MAKKRTKATGTDVGSSLARVVAELPAGEVREGQRQMAEAVADVLAGRGRRHVAVAAGTGTGKSLGYLVPAILSGQHVVVATATKGLQDQLATKDLPLIARGLDQPVTWAVLKGRSNYLCRQRLAEMERSGEQEQLDLAGVKPPRGRRRKSTGPTVSAGEPSSAGAPLETPGEEVVRLVSWAAETASGDRAELDFEPHPVAWSSVSVSGDECPGAHRCASGGDCFAEKARARAASAQVVVVNHHLLGAHLRSEGAVLPEHDALIVDEAHELEDILAASLGVDVGAGRVRGIAGAARGALTAAGAKSTSAVDDVLDSAVSLDRVLTATPEVRLPIGLGPELGDTVRLLVSRLGRLESALRASSSGGGGGDCGSAAPESAQRALRSLLAVERCREELELCLAAEEDTVVWVGGGDRRTLRSAPLDIRTQLREHVFSEMPVVLTSATMAPGLAERLGAPAADVIELDVGSPFDFENHGLMYCAVKLPDRRQTGAEEPFHDELEALILAAGGRTLALFTSRRAMERATGELRGRVPWPIHAQGDLPKTALVAAFTEEETSCLFATMGYWQGVDVPGATLSLVVIDKIPFPRPDDPLMAARREAAGPQGFRLVDLPRAATLLAQGAGRLIRSATDRGVVAVLDPRLATASYSGYLVKSLPRMRRTRDREEAVAFLRGIRAEALEA
ncbi:MAG: ATP-dependent DNA helicase [Acidimicrobiales bacterium]